MKLNSATQKQCLAKPQYASVTINAGVHSSRSSAGVHHIRQNSSSAREGGRDHKKRRTSLCLQGWVVCVCVVP